MFNKARKAFSYLVLFSFFLNNTAYAEIANNSTLRCISSANAHIGQKIASNFLNAPPDIKSSNIKTSSSGIITPEDIFTRKLALAIIKPDVSSDINKNIAANKSLFSRDDIIRELEDKGFEVITTLPANVLTRRDAEEFYSEHKDRLFFSDLIEYMTSDESVPVILRGPENAWQKLRNVLGVVDGNEQNTLREKLGAHRKQLPGNVNIIYNRIHGSDSFQSTLREILFIADKMQSTPFLGSGEKLLMSLSLESDRAYFSALYRQYKLQLLVLNRARFLINADASLTKDDALVRATASITAELKKTGRDKDALILADSKPLIIGQSFFPSALLSDKDFRDKLGAVQYDDIANDPRNIEAATGVTMVQNPLNGGIGQAMDRLGFLEAIWPATGRIGVPVLGAKAMDCYFNVKVVINGQEKEAFVSVAEATILSLLNEVERGSYRHGILEEFISSETSQAMEDLKNTVYLYDRLDPFKADKRTYGNILKEKNMLGIMPEQAMFPRFDVEDNYRLTDKYTAPGSHGHWGVYALSNIPDEELPQDGSIQIRSIFNGDGISNSPNNVIAGWMAREGAPVIMITTTRAPIDVKGGMLGVEYLDDEKVRKNMLELADAKTNDKEQSGQAELFKNMGISETGKNFGKEGMQLFNTNTVLLNDTVLQPFLRELRETLGIEEYNRAISPKMMMKSVVQKDGKEYAQLEGAMGSSMLNLAGFLSTNNDPQIIDLCKKHGIDPNLFLRLVNIDVNKRTDFFAPIKFPIDYWLQFFSDHFTVDTTTWKLKNLRPGHLPALDTPDQDKDEYYSNVLNLFNLFGDKGVLNKNNPVMTSTIGLDLLKLRGKVKIAGSILRGNVVVINEGDGVADLTTGEIQTKLLADNMVSLDNGKLVLEDVAIVIRENGKDIKAAKLQNKESIDIVVSALVSDKASSAGMNQETDIPAIKSIVHQARAALTQERKKGIEFGTSGFRGINSLNELTVAITAQANVDYIKEAGDRDKVFVIGRDTREQGNDFIMITAAVFADNGIKAVISDGYTPTPVIAHATVANAYGGAINFTASHNPQEYKGYKFTPSHGGAVLPEVTDVIQSKTNDYLKRLESDSGIIAALNSPYLKAALSYKEMFESFVNSGDIKFIDPVEAYVEYLFGLEMQGVKIFDKVTDSRLGVIASGLHGTAGPYFERIFGPKGLNKLAVDVLNRAPREDFGRFKSPEAKEANLKDVVDLVTRLDNVLGVSGDGDADREGIIDINSKFIEPNELAAIFYWYLHEIKGLKGGVAKTVATTNLLNVLAGTFNEECYEKQVGFKNFMNEILSGKAIVAAESSAHIGINAVSWDDAFLCALLTYQILSDKDNIKEKTGVELKALTDILDYIQNKVVSSYFSFYEGKIPADEATKSLLLSWNQSPEMLSRKLGEEQLLSILQYNNLEVAQISTLPKKGIKVVLKDRSWLCLRPSGTEPLVRLYAEGADKAAHEASKKKEILKKIAQALLKVDKEKQSLKASSSGTQSAQDSVELSSISRLFSQFVSEKNPDTLRSLIKTAREAMRDTYANPDKKEILHNAILFAEMRLLSEFPPESTKDKKKLLSKYAELERQWQKMFEKMSQDAYKVSKRYFPDEYNVLQYKLKMYKDFLVVLKQDMEELEDKLLQQISDAKSSSSGESKLSAERADAIEAELGHLFDITRETMIEGLAKPPIVKIDLARDDFLSIEFALLLERYRQMAVKEFGENIIMDILPSRNGNEGVRVGISVKPDSAAVEYKSSSSGILLTENDLGLIELAADVADLSDATGTIVYDDTAMSTEQQGILRNLLGKGTQGLADLEAKLGCDVRLMSQGDVSDNANTIIISDGEIPGFLNAKYLITEQTQIDTSYIAVTPLIAIAKGLLGLDNITSQPELYEALKSSIRSISQGLLNASDIEAAITAYINGSPMLVKLPPASVYDYDKLEQLYRQALMVLISA